MKKIIAMLLAIVTLMGCAPQAAIVNANIEADSKQSYEVSEISFQNKNYTKYVGLDDIKTDVGSVNKRFVGHFNRYVSYKAPNGRPIHILAQDRVSDEQLLKAYNVLSFYLTSHKSYDMNKVADEMANRSAVLMMPNGADGETELKESIFYGQPLYQMEVPVTGDAWYINNDYEHRDASYEEILHMVHDNGIGTAGQKGVLPKLQKEIETAMKNALPEQKKDWGKAGLWGYDSKDWLVELSREGSLEQEYIVSVLDSYYGLWDACKETKGGMWGIYVAKNRAEIKEKDPMGYDVLESFLPKQFTYMDRIDPSFEGTFSLAFMDAVPYTAKSQYIDHARLTGTKNSSLLGNNNDNILMGNAGNNTLDGGSGTDVVQFSGASTEYEITNNIVKDILGRDGTDTIKNIEILRFTDQDIVISK